MDKKIKGAAAALIGALLYGGSQVLDHEERIQDLENLAHPSGQLADDKGDPEAESELESGALTLEPASEEPGNEEEMTIPDGSGE